MSEFDDKKRDKEVGDVIEDTSTVSYCPVS